MRATVRGALRSKRGFFVESLRERFFTPAVWSPRSSATVNACSPSCRTLASAISARSCGLKDNAPMDGLRASRDGTFIMRTAGALCVPLTPRSLDEVFSSDLTGADCVEVRLDYLTNPQESIHVRWDKLPVPVIATCRGKERGGQFDGSIEEELQILDNAAGNGAKFVDIDYRFAKTIAGAQVIASLHDFDRTPEDVVSLLDRVCASSGQIAKIATMVNSWSDNRRLLDL